MDGGAEVDQGVVDDSRRGERRDDTGVMWKEISLVAKTRRSCSLRFLGLYFLTREMKIPYLVYVLSV